MSNIKHIICLKEHERKTLKRLVKNPKTPPREALRANILLASDTSEDAEPMTIDEIVEQFKTNKMAINRVKAAYLEYGLKVAIHGKKRKTPPVPAKINRSVENKIIRIFKSRPPQGKMRWSLSMIAKRAVEKEIVDSISTTSVLQILNKYGYNTYIIRFKL